MNTVRILIVEDETSKRHAVQQLIKDAMPDCCIEEARSFHGAMMKIRENRYDILVLDMRLPTFDVTGQESGGRPRNFGGEEILRKMQRKKIAIPTIVLTQYTVFADDSGDILNLDDLRERLGQLGSFRSLVHLSHSDPSWEGLFLRLLEELSSECQP